MSAQIAPRNLKFRLGKQHPHFKSVSKSSSKRLRKSKLLLSSEKHQVRGHEQARDYYREMMERICAREEAVLVAALEVVHARMILRRWSEVRHQGEWEDTTEGPAVAEGLDRSHQEKSSHS